MKCYVCKSGNLSISGSHEYCDNCNFSRFVITEGYIDACIVVLSELVSNTRFDSNEALGKFVGAKIPEHLPKLHALLSDLSGDPTGFIQMLQQGVMAQAINLQIDTDHYNVEEDDSFRCHCGSTSAYQIDMKYIACTHCEALYIYSEETHRYEPEFLCGECGEVRWVSVDDVSGLCECANCGVAHIHNASENTFRMVTSE